MKNPRFYEYNDYPYDFILRRALENGRITQSDHDLSIAYIEDKIQKGDIEDARAQRISTSLVQWRRFLPEYDKLTYKELLKGVALMRKGTTIHGRPYKPGTIRQQLKILKTFIRKLAHDDVVKITRDQLDEIKYPKEVFDSVKPKDILSNDKIENLIGAAVSIRDKAIISILADTGFRPVDICGLTWRDLDFNQRRVKITVTTEKTNTIVSGYVILHKSWLVELRKSKNNATDDSFVFVESDGTPLPYGAITEMLRRTSEKSGVTFPKGAWSKLFRASSITNKQIDGYSPVAISQMHFGRPNSKMLPHYSKYTAEDAENEALKKAGVLPIEPREIPKREVCPKCGEPCSPGIKFCPECSEPITDAAKAQKATDHKAANIVLDNLLKRIEALEKDQAK
jgi:integrase